MLVGRAEIIDRLRRHSLYRALRADKLRVAALEATLDAYARGATSMEVPTHRMIAMSFDELESRAKDIVNQIQQNQSSASLQLQIVEGESAIGGGAAPTARLLTPLISLTHTTLSVNEIEERLRRARPPVIARIEDDRVLLDLRTVAKGDEPNLISAVATLETQSTSQP
jgi:L-seryl-tRNA(Ser) seleniumtransferase